MEDLIIKIEDVEVGEQEIWSEECQCLICSKQCESLETVWWMNTFKSVLGRESNSENECLSSHLLSIFILRKILDYPKPECKDLLKRMDGKHPGEWFGLCLDCSEVVEKVVENLQQIVSLEKKIDELKKFVGDKLQESLLCDKTTVELEEKVGNTTSARDIIRHHFRSRCTKIFNTEKLSDHASFTRVKQDLPTILYDNDSEQVSDADADVYFRPIDKSEDEDETFKTKFNSTSKRRRKKNTCSPKMNSGFGHLACDICGRSPKTEYAYKMHMYRYHKQIYLRQKFGYRSHTGSMKSPRKQKSLNAHTDPFHNSLEQGKFDGTSITETSQVNPPSENTTSSLKSKAITFKISCAICKKVSKSEYGYRKHMYRYHKQVYFEQKLGHRANYRRMKSVKSSIDPIDNCLEQDKFDETSNTETSLVNPSSENISSQMNAETSKITCAICKKVSKSEYGYRKHMYRYHKQVYFEQKLGHRASYTNTGRMKSLNSSFDPIDNSLEQDKFDETSNTETSLVNLPSENISSQMNAETSKISCAICKKPSKTEYGYRKHMYRYHKQVYLEQKLGHRSNTGCRKSTRKQTSHDPDTDPVDNSLKQGNPRSDNTTLTPNKTFKMVCEICKKPSKSEYGYRKHMYRYHRQVYLQRKIGCIKMRAANYNKRKAHSTRDTTSFKMQRTRKLQGTRKLQYTKRIHKKRGYQLFLQKSLNGPCEICGMPGSDVPEGDYVLHRKTHMSNEEILEARSGGRNPYCGLLPTTEMSGEGDEVVRRICEICGKVIYGGKASMKTHLQVHLPDEERRSYLCSICGQKFYSKSGFDEHVKKAHPDGTWKGWNPCRFPDCKQSFNTEDTLKEHVCFEHSESIQAIQKLLCFQCGKTFTSSWSVKMHKTSFHSKEKVHECSLCPKSFSHITTLRIHLASVHRQGEHYGVFKCEVTECLEVFPCDKYLKRHLLRVHGIKQKQGKGG